MDGRQEKDGLGSYWLSLFLCTTELFKDVGGQNSTPYGLEGFYEPVQDSSWDQQAGRTHTHLNNLTTLTCSSTRVAVSSNRRPGPIIKH